MEDYDTFTDNNYSNVQDDPMVFERMYGADQYGLGSGLTVTGDNYDD